MPRSLKPPPDPVPEHLQYRVVVPFSRKTTRGAVVYGKLVYPLDRDLLEGVLYYAYEDAVDVLRVFTDKWVRAYSRPPVDLTPFAYRLIDPTETFTLWEVEPWSLVTEEEKKKDAPNQGPVSRVPRRWGRGSQRQESKGA